MSFSQLTPGNPWKQDAFEAVEEIPEDDDEVTFDDDISENDNPNVDEDGNLLATEEMVSDIDDDLAIDDEEHHEALLGCREARDFLKEARVARGLYLVVVPIHSDKPTSRGKGDSSSVKNLSGKTGRGKGGRVLKSSGRSLDSRGRGSGARDGTSNSQVCFECGSTDQLSEMDDVSSNPKKRNLGAHANGAWTCNIPGNSRVEKCSNHLDESVCLNSLCGTGR